jgi:hypothetical protein
MKFQRIKAKDLAALLLQHPEMFVLIEDQDAALVAHSRIHLGVVAHTTLGECLALSSISVLRNTKNFTYVADAPVFEDADANPNLLTSA